MKSVKSNYFLHLILFSISFASFVNCQCSLEIPYSQISALEALFYSTSGNDWCYSQFSGLDWNFSDPSQVCSGPWKGVECSCSQYHDNVSTIVSIQLSDACLDGTLPLEIGNLIELRNLSLSSNSLISSIPNTFGYLKDVYHIDLSTNSLSFSVPSELGELDNLIELDLLSNCFSGSIPRSIGNLSHLQLFHISSNSLSGTLPLFLFDMTNLTNLIVSFPLLDGYIPEKVSSMKNLEILGISSVVFTAPIPNEIYVLTRLTSLLLSGMFVGSISPSIENLTKLEYLYLSSDAFIGSIPSGIGNLENVIILQIYSSYLTSSIPESITSLSNCIYLYLASKIFSGSIPSMIGDLNGLVALYLYGDSLLTGPLPESLYTLQSLTMLEISGGFIGKLSPSIGNLQNLAEFKITSSCLSGEIPLALYQLPYISLLELRSTQLEGSFPSNFSFINSSISSFIVSSPLLTGTLPSLFSTMQWLSSLNINGGLMSGSFPTFLCHLPDLFSLSLNIGFMTSHLPSDVFSLYSKLMYFIVGSGLTGSLPDFPDQTLALNQLSLNDNYMTGTFPSSFSNIHKISQLIVANNYFSGELLNSLSSFERLQLLDLENNFFSGKFSDSPYSCSGLQLIYLGSNQFSGSLPLFEKVPSLSVIELQHNRFSGSLNEFFSNQTYVQNVDISDNLFSGELPQNLFNSYRIQVFAAVSNCFVGEIPSTVCSAGNILQSLVIDGLSSNPLCPANLRLNNNKPFFVQGFLQYHYMIGSVPDCIWSMPFLTTFHASGNGFGGSFPSSISTSLIDVSISNNRFSGTIPTAVQSHSFDKQLVLSNNRFIGRLSSQFFISSNQTSLTLAINQLSGNIPTSLLQSSITTETNLQSLSILAGNLFQCQTDQLPSLDSTSISYTCGSSDLYNAMFLWVTSLGTLLFMATIAASFLMSNFLTRNCRSQSALVREFYQEKLLWISGIYHKKKLLTSKLGHETTRFVDTLFVALTIAAFVVFEIVAILSLVYILFKSLTNRYSTIYDQYGWIWSIAFLSGVPIAVIVTVLVMSGVVFLTFSFENLYFRFLRIDMMSNGPSETIVSPVHSSSQNSNPPSHDPSSNVNSMPMSTKATVLGSSPSVITNQYLIWISLVRFSLVIVNVSINLLVNVVYIFAITYNNSISRVAIIMLQFSMGLYKSLWNRFFVPFSVETMKLPVKRSVVFRLALCLFNLVGAPLLASIVSNGSCFYNVFVPSGSINSSFDSEVCTSYQHDARGDLYCTSLELRTYSTSFIPPFIYNFQCSSSLVVIYIPVLLYSYVISGIVEPLFLFFSLDTKLSSWIKSVLLRFISCFQKVPMVYNPLFRFVDSIGHHLNGHRSGHIIVTNLMLHLTILLTFGVTCPFLALEVALTIFSHSIVWMMMIGKYSNHVVSNSPVEKDNTNIGSDIELSSLHNDIVANNFAEKAVDNSSHNNDLEYFSRDSWKGAHSSLALCVYIVGFFWALFLFDMIGTGFGTTNGAVVALLFMIVAPSVVLVTRNIIYYKILFPSPSSNILF